MARARDPARDKAFEIFKEHDGKIKNREIANLLGVPEKSIGGWKSKDKWNEQLNGVLQSNERSTPIEKEPRKKGAPVGNTNAVGNRGNLNASPPKRNTNAMKHGFYSRVIPDELRDVFDDLDDNMSMVDMLWDSIKTQYMAIMRAQSIMFVESKDEMIKELKKAKYDYVKSGKGEDAVVERILTEEEYNFQFAWERQAQFMTAQARAIGELRSSIEQFISMTDAADERRFKLEKMELDIAHKRAATEKVQIEINKLNGDASNTQESEIAKMLRKMAGDGE